MNELQSWKAEKLSAHLYRILSQKESNPAFAKLFTQLASEAENQATIWESKLKSQHIAIPKTLQIPFRVRVVAWLIQRIEPRYLLGILAAMKIRGLSVFRGHLNLHALPQTQEDIGKRHQSSSSLRSNLRAAIFGVNDGLVSNLALIMGVAGAQSQNETILLAGTAGLLAGAFSMAAGEYISVSSQREMFEYQIGLERDEMLLYPEEEAAELSLIYQARGFPKQEADQLATHIMQDPKRALDVLAKEELGMNPTDLASPIGAALSSFVAFGLGAIIPLLPFLLAFQTNIIGITLAVSGIFLFVIGMSISLWTGKNGLLSGLRMLGMGAAATWITYMVGYLFGVSMT